MRFFLGTHIASWLWDDNPRLDGVALFVSRNRLAKRVTPFPAARRDWALDSGGFTELKEHGGWRLSPEEYAAEVRRYREQLGRLLWAAPQDWMCEPWVIYGGTHNGQRFAGTQEARGVLPGEPNDFTAAVRMHQEFTVQNYLELQRIAPDLPWIPVLQGWTLADYERCAQMYADAGVDLTAAPVVGLGSVCRRQATEEIARIVDTFHARGLNLHGFGVKTDGLGDYGDRLVSADSMAWSFGARREPKLSGCTHRAKNCANCPEWALQWRQRVLARMANATPRQLAFDLI
ncbi:deazapurine DNA modification protein DpdA family protein [Streptomyces spiralis]